MQRALGLVCHCSASWLVSNLLFWVRSSATLTHLLSCCCPCMHQVDAAAAMIERLLQASPLLQQPALHCEDGGAGGLSRFAGLTCILVPLAAAG